MAEAYMGAVVRYGGHRGTFIADIFVIAGANVLHASRPITMENLDRDEFAYTRATHELMDFPGPAVWKPEHAFFVVPKKQVKALKPA
jgi:hypothetical protein